MIVTLIISAVFCFFWAVKGKRMLKRLDGQTACLESHGRPPPPILSCSAANFCGRRRKKKVTVRSMHNVSSMSVLASSGWCASNIRCLPLRLSRFLPLALRSSFLWRDGGTGTKRTGNSEGKGRVASKDHTHCA